MTPMASEVYYHLHLAYNYMNTFVSPLYLNWPRHLPLVERFALQKLE